MSECSQQIALGTAHIWNRKIMAVMVNVMPSLTAACRLQVTDTGVANVIVLSPVAVIKDGTAVSHKVVPVLSGSLSKANDATVQDSSGIQASMPADWDARLVTATSALYVMLGPDASKLMSAAVGNSVTQMPSGHSNSVNGYCIVACEPGLLLAQATAVPAASTPPPLAMYVLMLLMSAGVKARPGL